MAVYFISALHYRGPVGAKVGYPDVVAFGYPGRTAMRTDTFRRVADAFHKAYPDHKAEGVYTLEEALQPDVRPDVLATAKAFVAERDAKANAGPRPRGFAAMDPEKRRAIAQKGGVAVPADKRAFSNIALARTAGAKGGARNAKRSKKGKRK